MHTYYTKSAIRKRKTVHLYVPLPAAPHLPHSQSQSQIVVHVGVFEGRQESIESHQTQEHLLRTTRVPLVETGGELHRLLRPLGLQFQSVSQVHRARLLRQHLLIGPDTELVFIQSTHFYDEGLVFVLRCRSNALGTSQVGK